MEGSQAGRQAGRLVYQLVPILLAFVYSFRQHCQTYVFLEILAYLMFVLLPS